MAAFILVEISSGGSGGEAPPTSEEEAQADDETRGLSRVSARFGNRRSYVDRRGVGAQAHHILGRQSWVASVVTAAAAAAEPMASASSSA